MSIKEKVPQKKHLNVFSTYVKVRLTKAGIELAFLSSIPKGER